MRTNFSLIGILLVFLSFKTYSQNTSLSPKNIRTPLDTLVYFGLEEIVAKGRFMINRIPWFMPRLYNYDLSQVHPEALVRVNEVFFSNKSYLEKMPNCQIYGNSSDTSINYIYKKEKPSKEKPVPISAAVEQVHDDLPENFVTFRNLTLEELRYSCSVEQPFFDGIGVVSESVSAAPRYLIDGRLQPADFAASNLDLAMVESIQVYSPQDAKRYFSSKFIWGLVIVKTKKSNRIPNYLFKIRIVEEVLDPVNHKWTMLSDTVVANIQEHRSYRKAKLEAQSVIYLIDNRLENERVNRKTIDLDRVISIESSLGHAGNPQLDSSVITKNKIDTIRIKTRQLFSQSSTTMSKVLSELQQLRNTKKPEVPLYIVDNEEIDMEKLKKFSRNEIELVTVLSSCDGMQKYGKKAEFGAVIYKRKSPKTSQN